MSAMATATRATGGVPLALVAVGGLASLAGWAAVPAYGDVRVGALVIVAAAAAVGVAAACSRLTAVRAAATSAVGLGVLAAVVVPLAGPRPSTPGVGAAAAGVVHGWARLLTAAVPVGTDPALVVPVVVVVWLAAAAGAEMVLRTRATVAVALPATAALLGASVLAGTHQAAAGPLGALALALGALLLVARRAPPGDGEGSARGGVTARGAVSVVSPTVGVPGGRRPVGAAGAAGVGAAAVVVAAVVLGPALVLGRDAHPFDPRQHISQPTPPLVAVSPLDLVAARLLRPAVPMFEVQATSGQDWQLAVFDTFDGYDWSSSAAYLGGGTQVPADTVAPPAPAGLPTKTTPMMSVRQEITVQGLSGPWLPAAPRPTLVEGVAFRADTTSGALVAVSGAAAGAHYRVTSEVPAVGVATLTGATVATDPAAERATVVPPGLPGPLGRIARVAAAGAPTPFTQALLLERYLRLTYHLDPTARAGHSYGHLLDVLTSAKVGGSEQFATAFAVMGRVLGLPTRVVVGFSSGHPTAVPGRYQVRSGDAKVWPEVDFSGAGWVPFDPTPSAATGPGPASLPVGGIGTRGQQSFVIAPGRAPPAVPPVAPPPPTAASPLPPHPAAASSPTWPLPVAAGVAALTVTVIVAATAVVVAKGRRTARRRHRGDARQRAAGAWATTLDRLAQAGVTGTATLTVAEVVAAGDAALGPRARALAGLYRPVLAALYDPAEPDDDDAERCWRSYDRLSADLSHRQNRLRRLAVAVDPRPLMAHRRTPRLRKDPA